jgi:hypothetical protein
VRRLRAQLGSLAPPRREQSRNQLIATLRALAPLGWDLYTAMDTRLQDAVRDRTRELPDAVLQIALAQGTSFTLPWSFVYDIYLPSDVRPEQLALCETVENWDGRSPLVQAEQRSCVHAADPSHRESVLCPFGFWGYRHAIETLVSTDRAANAIRCPREATVAVGETSRGVRADALARHLQTLTDTFSGGPAGRLRLRRASGATELRELIEADVPFLYLICHGERGERGNLLALGQDERVSPQDLIGWIDVAANRGRRMWSDPQPFVFLNACGSLDIEPKDLVDYLSAFLGKGRAVGLIGTEARVEQGQAMQLAESFFAKLMEPNATVEHALRHVRNEFLMRGNLFGLTYTPYCFADLAVSAIPTATATLQSTAT